MGGKAWGWITVSLHKEATSTLRNREIVEIYALWLIYALVNYALFYALINLWSRFIPKFSILSIKVFSKMIVTLSYIILPGQRSL